MGTQPAAMGPTLWAWSGDGDRNNGDGCGWGQVLCPMQFSSTCIPEIDASMDMDIAMDVPVKSVDMDKDVDAKFHFYGKPGFSFSFVHTFGVISCHNYCLSFSLVFNFPFRAKSRLSAHASGGGSE